MSKYLYFKNSLWSIIFSFFFCGAVPLFAQDILWTRTYGGSAVDFGYSVQQTTDGGYIVAGPATSESGGSFFDSVYVIKTDSTGDILWTHIYGGGWASSLQQTTDGGYIVAGFTSSFGVGRDDAMLTKLDSLGNTCIGGFVSSTVTSVSPTELPAQPQ